MSKKKRDPREVLLSLIPFNAQKILDVGCAEGKLSSKLKKRNKNIEIIGIEQKKAAARYAEKYLDRVHIDDVVKIQLPYPKKYFDCILYADILEHLIDPCCVLKKYREYLSDEGYIVASIPNVRYYKIIIRLIFGGTWDYMEKGGLLDKGHLRFFTLINIKELIEGSGFRIMDIKRNIVSSRGFRILNYLFLNLFRNFLAYQYFIKAKKSSPQINLNRKKYQF